MAEGKINIKIGNIEVSYEGDDDYIRNDLLPAIGKLKEIFSIDDLPQDSFAAPKNDHPITPDKDEPICSLTDIATKLAVKKGPELVLASALHLTLFEESNSFTRKELLLNMKNATNHYKNTYSKNLSQYITVLLKNNRLNEVAKDTYSLPIEVKEELENSINL